MDVLMSELYSARAVDALMPALLRPNPKPTQNLIPISTYYAHAQLRTGNIAHRRVKVETPLLVKNDIYDVIHSLPPRSIYHNDLLLTRKLKRSKPFSLRSSYWCVLIFSLLFSSWLCPIFFFFSYPSCRPFFCASFRFCLHRSPGPRVPSLR